MSEFYTMPINVAKTNGSWVPPTAAQGSIFSFHHHSDKDSFNSHEHHHHSGHQSFGKKFSSFFGRSKHSEGNKI